MKLFCVILPDWRCDSDPYEWNAPEAIYSTRELAEAKLEKLLEEDKDNGDADDEYYKPPYIAETTLDA